MKRILRENKKVSRGISLSDAECVLVEQFAAHGGVIGDSFSAKLSWLIKDYANKSEMLVAYDVIEDKIVDIIPKYLDQQAERVYADTDGMKGWVADAYEAEIAPYVKTHPKMSLKKVPEFVEWLKEQGFKVQIVDYPNWFEIWVSKKVLTGGKLCHRCDLASELTAYVQKFIREEL